MRAGTMSRRTRFCRNLGLGTFSVLVLHGLHGIFLNPPIFDAIQVDIDKTRLVSEDVNKSNATVFTGKCQKLPTSQMLEKLIGINSKSDLSDWKFINDRQCESLSINTQTKLRWKLSLQCREENSPFSTFSKSSIFTDIYRINFKDACLANFIETCCYDDNPVPNIVHLVWFGTKEINFFNFLSLMSVLRFQNPCLILIHGPDLPRGPYWDYFLRLTSKVVHVYRERPTQVFGNNLKFKEHSSDIMRIEALMEYGGIYLDFDEVLLRPLEPLRRFPYTQGHELPTTMGSQLVMAQKGAEFLKLWYQSYRDNYRKIWAYNALWVPNTLAKTHPHLIHVEGFNFTRPNWKDHKIIFENNYDWSTNYGMHMYARWYKRQIDVNVIRTLNTTVGSVARHILLGNKELCSN